jgi:hypothetical protein
LIFCFAYFVTNHAPGAIGVFQVRSHRLASFPRISAFDRPVDSLVISQCVFANVRQFAGEGERFRQTLGKHLPDQHRDRVPGRLRQRGVEGHVRVAIHASCGHFGLVSVKRLFHSFQIRAVGFLGSERCQAHFHDLPEFNEIVRLL